VALRIQHKLNVQQQNARTEESIRAEAGYWRQRGVPVALLACGLERDVLWQRSIVISLDLDFPGMPSLFGVLVTQDERFIRFVIDTDAQHSEVRSIDEWEDITEEQNLNRHNRGFGSGTGALAIKVLREINAEE
jgi:hypothetical protein